MKGFLVIWIQIIAKVIAIPIGIIILAYYEGKDFADECYNYFDVSK